PNEDKELLTTEIKPEEIKTIQNPAFKISNRGVLQMLGIHIDKIIPRTTSNPNTTITNEQNTSELKDESSIELDDSRAPVIKPDSSKETIVPILKLFGKNCFYHCGWMFLLSLVVLFLATQTLLVSKDIWLSKWSNDWNKHGEDEYSGHYLTAYNVLCILGVINMGALSVVAAVAATRAYNSIYNAIVDAAISFNNFSIAKSDQMMTALKIHFAQLDEDLSVSIIIFIVSLVAVHSGVNGSLTPGFIGLALVYILMLPYLLKWLIYSWPQMRSDMQSLKELEPHSRISQENNDGLMIPDWPEVGKIQVENLSVTPSMTRVSFLINAGEKTRQKLTTRVKIAMAVRLSDAVCPIAVCLTPIVRLVVCLKISGQTAAGQMAHGLTKQMVICPNFMSNVHVQVGICSQNGSDLSALAKMFVRLTPVPKESIFIDDSDIFKILPTLLRLRIAIISNNDCVLDGTIRSNLDMKGSFGDEEIWSVLKTIGLKHRISKLNGGLDYELNDDSKIFANHENQLLCLGRAILHRPKIIITNELDATLLKTVFDVFPMNTTIALSTEQNSLTICDRIVELEYTHIDDTISVTFQLTLFHLDNMKLFICSFLWFFAACEAIPLYALIADAEWTAFKELYNKTYSNIEEDFRHKIFMENKLKVIEHNNRYNLGIKSYALAINEFSDLLPHEFSSVMLGLSKPNKNANMENSSSYLSPSNVVLPKSVDWRKKGYVTPVKNQGQCGSCWAFSTTGSLEGQHFRKTGALVSLSEQNLVDCSYLNHGCNGGIMDYAFQYIKKNGGIDTEDSYKYEMQVGPCRFKKSSVGATVTGFVDVTTGDENALAEAVATVGPVSVAIDASDPDFQHYSRGVYYKPDCSSTNLDHGVLVVGFGTDEKQNDFWLVKNSWGASWGDEGYIKMARNRENNCGIATLASYPLV
uniref:Cathepsin L n=1 Tax=Strigamia maritima TaxID=126957 RepID=T1J339_STRMM